MAGNEAIMEKSVRRRRVRPQQDAEQHIKLKMTRLVSQSILSTHTKVSSYISEYVIVSSVSLMTTQVVMNCKDNGVCLECLLNYLHTLVLTLYIDECPKLGMSYVCVSLE